MTTNVALGQRLSAAAGILRLNFLSFTLVSIALLVASQDLMHLPRRSHHLWLVVVLALLAHAAVNAWNEYFDYRSGLDLTTSRTPFSGGSGTLPNHPQFASFALSLALCSTVLVALGGLWLCMEVGWHLAWFGVPGLLLVVWYTGPVHRWPWLCLIAPGLGFGVFMVAGGSVALTGAWHNSSYWPAALMFLLANNLLLLNQFPDIDADRLVGRRHLAIVYGPAVASRVFALQWWLIYGVVLAAVWLQQWPPHSVLVLFTWPLYWYIRRLMGRPAQFARAMALHVALVHVVPLSLCGLWQFG